MTMIVESSPFGSRCSPHDGVVDGLVALGDGSFVSCSRDNTAKRWLVVEDKRNNNNNNNDSSNGNNGDYDNDNGGIRLIGTYIGHTLRVSGVIEKDENTLITGSRDYSLKEWNKTTCECLTSVLTNDAIWSLAKTKDNTRIVCGLFCGKVELRKIDDLSLIHSFDVHSHTVFCICELTLTDGSFVSGSGGYWKMVHWDEKGTLTRTFDGHVREIVRIIELSPNLIVSASIDQTLKIWRVSTGECLYTMNLPPTSEHALLSCGLVRLSAKHFVSGEREGEITVWNARGDSIQTIQTTHPITTMAIFRDTIATASDSRLELRHLK